ncbi:GspH/FimT family pseudopilin [Tahibacter caeni]|uniref:GspH/FimT family pseudopilin n=1 Tax=Tahibacter caeni TaxID=1453545 RepID=UPI002147AE72|nr:GspH/FimT family pseudopilin [Tahibacter caeni]
MTFLQRRGGPPGGLRSELGFSLIELVITLAVLSIGLAVALPMFRSVIRNTAVSGQTNDLVTALAMARSEAVRRGLQVAVVAASGGSDWSSGWRVVADDNRDGSFAGADEVIQQGPALDPQYHIFARNIAGGSDANIVFNINGAAASAFDINVCYPTGEAIKSRRIQVRASGNVSSFKGTSGSAATTCPAGT